MASSGVWTSNWEGIKNYLLCGFVRDGWSTIKDENGNIADGYSGATPMGDYQNLNYPTTNAPVIIFGTGSTAPSVNDLGLAHKWTTNISRISLTNGSRIYDDTTHTATKTITTTVQNTGSNPVTITEWGIVGRAWRGTNNNFDVLMYRALLDTPVTLNQYESATLTVTITVQLTNPI